MNSSTEILEMYEGYYADGSVSEKRAIAARQSVGHIRKITEGQTFNSVVDIGAGEGAVLSELSNSAFAKQFAAVEISKSGLDAISNRRIKNLASVDQFDGYKIPHPGKAFDLALAIHVLEHVEHERMFLYEARRVSRKLYIEVPLELTRNLDKSIRESGPYGHINFYTPGSFENLLKTCGFKVERLMVFPHDIEYEQHLAGKAKGWLKYQIRQNFLKLAPKTAARNMVYMAGALCSA
ncbi:MULTISPECIES: class I SAM-dependent methyltransferase [Rhizobium]|uniref:Putative S-adenosyl-L-methionine (SAM)-MTase n=2 Tax=Rhizobium TaxID=379 RepID=Q7WYS5_RHIJ3|nr:MULTISPECIES: class I SAM-dependent methyltransferase [Rhizobium]MBY3030274.1 class I SAM-dependent methyltransferase [Rhizobium leguminosarum]MBY3213754.1 class I SAM-dependent methyltransferase [Rhizobium laguerreae]MBY3229638.1 class I SAM-dependent methyltransferase [Rhizobium laguerreae]MBY5393072.1 class I SAM-dependent methyltransferase [Rhizobium leguminosarum]MBY5410135.1 class I SAM-dependent methyltransferase [Rhizobium leguminosarum]